MTARIVDNSIEIEPTDTRLDVKNPCHRQPDPSLDIPGVREVPAQRLFRERPVGDGEDQ
jgi:hypothetical protein